MVVVMHFGLTCFMQGLKYYGVCNDRINNTQECNVETRNPFEQGISFCPKCSEIEFGNVLQ